MKASQNQPKYGNWVPEKLLILLWSLSAVSLALLLCSILWWKNLVCTAVFAIASVIIVFYAVFMQMLHHSFSFRGGQMTGKIHEFLLEHLPWDGNGTLLDIGCGSGALTLRSAKTYPDAHVVGLDYWGAVWNYAKEQCESNAAAEGVKTAEFIKGDAAKLPYKNETFDAVVSNFVFHEVRTVKDKRTLVKEALRVVKKGGSFSFHDLFEEKNLYGDIDLLIEELRQSGISEIHYISHTENLPFVPGMIKPMFKNMGLLYGKK